MPSTILKNEQATIDAGAAFAKKLRGGDIVLLHGELGAGKTTFVKGIAKGLGIKENITSPTFTLMGVYNLSFPRMRESSNLFFRLCAVFLDARFRGHDTDKKKL
ncbi:MAG: tRNA (adenosine(37)-N6)-threonylcarbamoyltransferase complex ATPase subunit type 1 TsaE [Patescibacteria group bacterium]